MKNKVSIIVPVYNVENYIERCIDSLINQTLIEIEIILVDDGSTDDSGNICDRYETMDDRIKVIHKKNEGQGLSRNKGLDIATGKYVIFLDSDDYYELDTCESLFNKMESVNADMCSFGYEIDSPKGDIVRVPIIKEDVYENQRVSTEFVLHFFGDDPSDDNLRGFSSCMSCFKLDIIKEHNIYFPSEREILTEDTVFCLEYLKYARKVITVSKVYYHYCQKEDSFSQGFRADRMEKTKKMVSILEGYAKGYNVLDLVNERLAMYVWVNLMAYLKQDVRRIGEKKYSEIYVDIHNIIYDEEIRSRLLVIKIRNLSYKQRILMLCVKIRYIRAIVVICKIRATKEL